jgi:hypothetical protein
VVKSPVFQHKNENVIDSGNSGIRAKESRDALGDSKQTTPKSGPRKTKQVQSPPQNRAENVHDEPAKRQAKIQGDDQEGDADPGCDPIPGSTKEARDAVPGSIPMAFLPGRALVGSLISPLRARLDSPGSPIDAAIFGFGTGILAIDSNSVDDVCASGHVYTPSV